MYLYHQETTCSRNPQKFNLFPGGLSYETVVMHSTPRRPTSIHRECPFHQALFGLTSISLSTVHFYSLHIIEHDYKEIHTKMQPSYLFDSDASLSPRDSTIILAMSWLYSNTTYTYPKTMFCPLVLTLIIPCATSNCLEVRRSEAGANKINRVDES